MKRFLAILSTVILFTIGFTTEIETVRFLSLGIGGILAGFLFVVYQKRE